MKVGSFISLTEKEISKFGLTLDEVKESLTLPNPEFANRKRFGKGRFFGPKIDSHICYLRKQGDQYILPRYYFNTNIELTDAIRGREITSECSIKLRDYQEEFVFCNKSEIEKSSGILIEMPCGHGKTLMAIWLSYQHGVQTMVLVPTYYLAKQWKERLEQFTTASVTLLKSTDTEIPTDSDFTIVVMDLFSCRTLPKELIENVGHVILDEAHRVGAETYLPILDEIPAYYRTALTATFRRTDGVHRILKYHFGKHLKMTNRFPRPFAYGIKTGVQIRNIVSKNRPYENFLDFLIMESVDYHETNGAIEFGGNLKELRNKVDILMRSKVITKTAHREIASCLKKGSELSYPVVESYLNDHSGRRKLAIRMIQKCLDEGRTTLFLSKRKDTLKSLSKYFSGYKPMLIVSETNSRSDEDEKYLQESCPLIFGVTQLAKEGLDIDRLDTLIIHLPMKDTEQAIGRIARLCKDKKTPLCLYMLDDRCPITYATYTNAKKYFNINAEHRGERTFDQLNWKCLE